MKKISVLVFDLKNYGFASNMISKIGKKGVVKKNASHSQRGS